MLGKVSRCVICSLSPRSAMRQERVRQLAKRLGNESVYPPMYRLLDKLPLCVACMEAKLPFQVGPQCLVCGRVMMNTPDERCTDCQRYADGHLLQNRSMMAYQEWGKEVIRQLKYRGDEHLSAMLATLLAIGYYRYYSHIPFRIVTNVPLHPSRLRERGFDQAALLAKHFAESVNLSYFPLLRRVKNTDKLSKQAGRFARYQSMHNAFAPCEEWASRTWKAAPHILIIDDIYTTGSTLRACASAIHSLPSLSQASIRSLTLFR
ncbi:ComF family protein [Brevibacillus migulae]|uniref:ComF family protein n=1 Tax=Brevibacillus migulae TaxID=1644114 RepID=UPI00106EF2EA|nr:ComF family protein [Brevibacillus migulae]